MAQEVDPLLTVKEAADRIGVSESAIRNATLDNRLKFEQMYGRKLIRLSDVLDYQARTQRDSTSRSGKPKNYGGDTDPYGFCARLVRTGFVKTDERLEDNNRRKISIYAKEGYESIEVQVFPANELTPEYLEDAYRKMRGPDAD
ncbi:MAG: helix-turn-helix domain-containing protein [Armatimonadota bacterium]